MDRVSGRVPRLSLKTMPGMANMRPKNKPGETSSDAFRIVETDETVEIHVPALNSPESSRWISRCVAINLKVVQDDEKLDDHQVVAYYLGAIVSVIPTMEETVAKAFKAMGLTLVCHRYPWKQVPGGEECPVDDLDAIVAPPPKKMYIMIMIIILFMFKNVQEQSYENFTVNRLKAMIAVIGYTIDEDESMGVFASINHARLFRTIVSGMPELRKRALRAVITYQVNETMVGQLCTYVATILNWTEMAGILFISNMLCVTNSPVLRDSRVAHEVLAYHNAMREVTSFEYPQYFRILAEQNKQRLLHRANFPILMAVAQKLQTEVQSNVSQFFETRSLNNSLVEELVADHRNAMRLSEGRQLKVALDFLTDSFDIMVDE